MDEPTPPFSTPEPDLPRPPIWEERRPTTEIPTIIVPGSNEPVVRRGPTFEPAPAPAPVNDQVQLGGGVAPIPSEPPRWPSAGVESDLPNPTEPNGTGRRRRYGLAALGLVVAAALAAASFFIGRGVGSTDVVDAPIATTVPTEQPQPTAEPEPTAVPTEAPEPTPAPTPEPTEAPQNDATLDSVSGVIPQDAIEPVTAVANAVSPAVVLIQHEGGQGSGIIYDADGLILTNAHVVGQVTNVSVQLASGIRVEGAVLGADANTDVAVVRIDTDAEFGVAPLAPEGSVEVGQLAVAIGSPFGLDQTVTSGIVSATGRVVGAVAMIQTDAPINPGNSGGALADRQGRVIGMNTAIRTDGSGGNIGVGFAIPSDTAKLIADRILSGDSLERGYLGVEGVTPQIGDPGVIVTNVLPDTGAESAGVQIDDLIVGFNGEEIRTMGDLAAAVRLQPPGVEVPVEVVRDGRQIVLFITLGVLPS